MPSGARRLKGGVWGENRMRPGELYRAPTTAIAFDEAVLLASYGREGAPLPVEP